MLVVNAQLFTLDYHLWYIGKVLMRFFIGIIDRVQINMVNFNMQALILGYGETIGLVVSGVRWKTQG